MDAAGFLAHYSPRKAVLVTAALFAVFHLNPWQAVIAFPLGVASAWLVLKTGSLVPSILSHAVVNSTSWILEWTLGRLGYDVDWLVEMSHPPLAVLACDVAPLVIGGYRVYRDVTSRVVRQDWPMGCLAC